MNNRMRQMMPRRGMMMGPDSDWCFPESKADEEQVILVGLDPKPFEDARKRGYSQHR